MGIFILFFQVGQLRAPIISSTPVQRVEPTVFTAARPVVTTSVPSPSRPVVTITKPKPAPGIIMSTRNEPIGLNAGDFLSVSLMAVQLCGTLLFSYELLMYIELCCIYLCQNN